MAIEARSKSSFLGAISLARAVVTHRAQQDPSVAQRTEGARARGARVRTPSVSRFLSLT